MYINRNKYLEKLIRYKDKDIVKIITGVRRCGKSVLLNNIYRDYLLKNGVSQENIISISFDLKKWENLKNSDKLYKYFLKTIKNEKKYYVILDEIQLVDGFEEVVNSIKNEFNTDIYITGSNSHLLSSDINTIFRGRGIEIKVFPFSFQELAFSLYESLEGRPYTQPEFSSLQTIEDIKARHKFSIIFLGIVAYIKASDAQQKSFRDSVAKKPKVWDKLHYLKMHPNTL